MTEPGPRAKEGRPQLPEASKSKDAHEGFGNGCGKLSSCLCNLQGCVVAASTFQVCVLAASTLQVCVLAAPFSCAHEHAGAESGSDKSDGRYYRTACLEACNTPDEQRAEIRQHLFYNVRYYLVELDLLPDALLTRRDKMAGYITSEQHLLPMSDLSLSWKQTW